MEQYYERLRKKLADIYNVENLDSNELYEMLLSEKKQQIHSNVGEMLNNCVCIFIRKIMTYNH